NSRANGLEISPNKPMRNPCLNKQRQRIAFMIFEKSTTISDADQNFGPITKLPMDSCYLPQSSVLAETGPPVRMKRCGADKARNCGSQPHQFGASIPNAGYRLLEKMTAFWSCSCLRWLAQFLANVKVAHPGSRSKKENRSLCFHICVPPSAGLS